MGDNGYTNVLFLCTGNSCRSPMAAAIARRVFNEKNLKCRIRSAGVSAVHGAGASANAKEVVKKYGADLSEHVTYGLTADELAWSDLVITMTRPHKDRVVRMSPESANKIFTIYEYAENSSNDLQDPFMGDAKVYGECADELYRLINLMAYRLAKSTSEMPGDEVAIVNESELIAIASDHGGFALKEEIVKYLKENNIKYEDYGTNSGEPVNYPLYAEKVTSAIIKGKCSKGILLCGTGIGISIAANRVAGIRAALCTDSFMAKAARLHNDANILVLGGRCLGVELAFDILEVFLKTPFSIEERHLNRVRMIDAPKEELLQN